jgi:hypothetical protein
MSTTGPGKPSARRVAAALPPVRPLPMITIGFPLVGWVMRYILPPRPHRLVVDLRDMIAEVGPPCAGVRAGLGGRAHPAALAQPAELAIGQLLEEEQRAEFLRGYIGPRSQLL